MSDIQLAMSCYKKEPCFENFLTSPGAEKSNIIAVALVNRGALKTAGVTEESLSNGTFAAADVIGKVRDLQLLCKAVYFPKDRINGKKAKPKEVKAALAFGLRTEPATTGDVTSELSFTYEYFYSTQTVKWFNWLRENSKQYDLVYWTESYVHIVEGKDLTFVNIGTEQIAGNSAQSIYGGFDVNFTQYGEPVPYGIIDATDLEGYTKLEIASPSFDAAKLEEIVCTGDCKSFVSKVGGPLTTDLTFTIASTANCVSWQLHRDCNTNAVAEADPVQIDSTTGKLTVTAMPANTEVKYRVVAITNCCVVGEYCLSIKVKA